MFPCWTVPFLAFDHVIPVLPWKTNPLLTLSSLWLLIYHVMKALWNGHWNPVSHDAISEWKKLSNIGLLVENMASRVAGPRSRRDVAWMAAYDYHYDSYFCGIHLISLRAIAGGTNTGPCGSVETRNSIVPPPISSAPKYSISVPTSKNIDYISKKPICNGRKWNPKLC